MSNEQEAPRPMSDRETMSDLKAAVGARRELGPEMEDEVLETFLARVEARVGAQVAPQSGSKPIANPKGKGAEIESPVVVVGGSLVLSIPSLAIAGDIGGTLGLFLVVCALVALNLLYFIDRWVRMG